MKSLLCKDWYVLKGQMKLLLLGMAVMAVFPNPMTQSIAILYAALLSVNTVSFDEQAQWDRYAAMLPYSARQIVLSKYLVGFLGVLAVGALAAFGAYALAPLDGAAPGEGLSEILTLLAVALAAQALMLPLVFKLGVERARVGFVIVVGLMMGAYLLLRGRQGALSPAANPVNWAWALAAALVAASIPLSIRFYQKRVF